MKETKADIILHPVRMRIIQTLINGRRLTVQQISEKVKDIPQATLYRHLKKLVDAQIIQVVEENRVRGTVEKVYALPAQSGVISAKEIANWDKEDHMNYFLRFMATVLADFERYLDQDDFDMERDKVGYRQVSFYATDEEYLKFSESFQREIMKLLENDEGDQRRKRTLTTIVTSEKQ